MNEKKKLRVNSRVTEDIYNWYSKTSKVRGMNISEFIRKVPEIITKLNEQLDDKENEILTLKEKLDLC